MFVFEMSMPNVWYTLYQVREVLRAHWDGVDAQLVRLHEGLSLPSLDRALAHLVATRAAIIKLEEAATAAATAATAATVRTPSPH